jgi:hypothetical protein
MRAFLDFEASSLGKDSYPIEVAWVFEDGRSETHLIRPAPAWTDWDERAAAIHGILRADLEIHGTAAEVVAARLLAELGGHPVYASSPSWDGKWLSVLLRAGGLPRHALRLLDTDRVQWEAATEGLRPTVPPDAIETLANGVIRQVQEAAANWPIAHRALADAEHERQLWLEIRAAAKGAANRYSSR